MTKLLFLVPFFVLSCSAPPNTETEPQSPTEKTSSKTGKADQPVTQTECSASAWLDDEVVSYGCTRDGDRWKCLCNETSFYSDEIECRDALMDSCQVEENVFGGCHSQLGQCNPDGDDIRCECDSKDETFTTNRENCAEDLFGMCANSCTVGENSCVPNPGLPDNYRCSCGIDAPKSMSSSTCESALDVACNRVACSGWTGYCQEVTSPEPGYECQCVSGETETISINDLGGGDCNVALEGICGIQEETGCESEDAQGWRRCQPAPGRSDLFDCSCLARCANDDRMIVDSFYGSSCEETLGSFCDFDALCAR